MKKPSQASPALSVLPLSIERELKSSFLDYAMSVIVSRALPDVRDGLKPVHRRILYAMYTLGLFNERAYRKSATVVGEVIGSYHPHGNEPIYQAMVGLAQDFSKRYPLLDGQGNWGSIDGDNAAAYRYTEVRMAKITRELLYDIDKQTVQFQSNFDESKLEPTLLPSRLPNLLINGSNGIAVGMATSIPPHNLGEIVDACLALLKNPHLTDDELFSLVPGPDFPTGGIICGRSGIVKAYKTGHGNVVTRAVVDIEESSSKNLLIIKEIPYQVNKAALIEKIADLVKEKVIEGITNIRDESNRDGIRVVIDIRRGDVPQVVLNQLFKHTSLQVSHSIMLLALLDNTPHIFTLREMLEQFLVHRQEVIRRRSEFDLDKNKGREHLLIGLIKALENIDAVVALIRASKSGQDASEGLCKTFAFSEVQAKAILDMRLQRLTALEVDKITTEIAEVRKVIAYLELLLSNHEVLIKEVVDELEAIKSSYADKRRSRIEGSIDQFEDIDLIPNDEVVVTLTSKGYIKRVALDVYAVQHRGGKGKRAVADLGEADDVLKDVFVAKNHDDLLFFTNLGRVYTLSVYQVPEASRTARGRAIVNLIPLTPGEVVVKLLCAAELQSGYVVMVTSKGVIKKTEAVAFSNVRKTGIHAINLNEGDELAFCAQSTGSDDIVLATSAGQGIRFKETEVRPMGRHSAGVRGVRIRGNSTVVGLEVIQLADAKDLLFVTSAGYGKRVRVEDFRVAHRGGLGVRTIPVGKRNGEVIGVALVSDQSSILLIEESGKIIRLSPQEVRTMRRGAQGVRLIRLDEGQRVFAVASFDESLEEENENSQNPVESAPNSTSPVVVGTIVEDDVMDEGDEELFEEDEFPEDDTEELDEE
ncbi:DNA gyrase subunit A [Candidatus Dependentiae bacterium]|nr:DNA gyrase subunit A [Candidatus Dependentiae bacterium]